MQGGRLSFGVYRRPRDAGALNARRSFSHLTPRNSKKRSSAVKGGRGEEGRRYASGVNRVVQTGAETVFLRAHLNSSDRTPRYFFEPCFFFFFASFADRLAFERRKSRGESQSHKRLWLRQFSAYSYFAWTRMNVRTCVMVFGRSLEETHSYSGAFRLFFLTATPVFCVDTNSDIDRNYTCVRSVIHSYFSIDLFGIKIKYNCIIFSLQCMICIVNFFIWMKYYVLTFSHCRQILWNKSDMGCAYTI